jgi:UDP-GlcNAc3NAcA epimerase
LLETIQEQIVNKRIVTILGARPQFIKAAPVSRVLRKSGFQEFLVHTGQHYDYEMSQVFFDDLDLPEPDINLGIGSESHGRQTGKMLMAIEDVLLREKPDWMLVYGDTNSTLAGALAAIKLLIPIAHVEAGLRSFNREMPEEHNRVITDHCADLLFCPTQTAMDNLHREGLTQNVVLAGDTMYDAVLQFSEIAESRSRIMNELGLQPKQYLLATVHRPYNTDRSENLMSILNAFFEINEPIVFPVHPRTRQRIAELEDPSNTHITQFQNWLHKSSILMINPLSYLDMLVLERNARLIITDSGGMQKEAFFFRVPCITLRPETEWVETIHAGWNILTGADSDKIIKAVLKRQWPDHTPLDVFGDGHASERIVGNLIS